MECQLSERISAPAGCPEHFFHWACFSLRRAMLFLALLSYPSVAQNMLVLVGTGSSVPTGLYSRWTKEYNKRNRGVEVRYLPTSNAEGLKLIKREVSDFAAGEARLTDKERKEAGLIEMPAAVIGIVLIYNLPNIHQSLRLSGEVVAEIFMGEVKTWNDPQMARLNPEIGLPNLPIRVVNRPVGKGSNYVFTEFLSKVDPKFRTRIGVTTSPKWPVGTSAQRSSDMVDQVKNTVGSIGFVEYHYAAHAGLAQAAVLDPAGRFVVPSTASIGAACNAAELSPANGLTASLTNAPGIDSYPIAGFTWLYLRMKPTDAARGSALNDFLNWIYGDGQPFAAEEGYPVLPAPLLALLRKAVKPAATGSSQEAAFRPR